MLLKYTPLAAVLLSLQVFAAPAPTATHSASVTSTSVQSAVAPAADKSALTVELDAQLTEITKKFLSAHPEILTSQDALLNDKATPSVGPADAKVALVEFFDYQCSVCAQQAPILESLMQANPQVRYVFKEWPIFGARWPASMAAAETGLQIWQQKGADAYLAYHNAVFATGHNEGKLTSQDITQAAEKVGKLTGKKAEVQGTLSQIDALAQSLGFRGTPAMIVMPVSGATANNVTVLPGGTNQVVLQAAINKAAGQ